MSPLINVEGMEAYVMMISAKKTVAERAGGKMVTVPGVQGSIPSSLLLDVISLSSVDNSWEENETCSDNQGGKSKISQWIRGKF